MEHGVSWQAQARTRESDFMCNIDFDSESDVVQLDSFVACIQRCDVVALFVHIAFDGTASSFATLFTINITEWYFE